MSNRMVVNKLEAQFEQAIVDMVTLKDVQGVQVLKYREADPLIHQIRILLNAIEERLNAPSNEYQIEPPSFLSGNRYSYRENDYACLG